MSKIHIVTTCDNWRSYDSMTINNIVTVTDSPEVVIRAVRAVLDIDQANNYTEYVDEESYARYRQMSDHDLYNAAMQSLINGIHVTTVTKDDVCYDN